LSEKLPNWYRGIQIVLGIVAIVLAVLVLLLFEFAVAFMIFLFALGLMIVGFSGIISGASSTAIPSWRRSLSIVLGVLSIVVAILAIIFPLTGISILIILLAIGLLINGIIGIDSGATNSDLPGWHRAIYVILGVVLVVFSIIILLEPTLGTIYWLPIIPPVPFLIPLSGTFLPPWGLIFLTPSLGYFLLVFLFSIGLMIRGIHSIVSGARGTE
jgi:uncharacterized membrane protein HdeD (DUF308 family)